MDGQRRILLRLGSTTRFGVHSISGPEVPVGLAVLEQPLKHFRRHDEENAASEPVTVLSIAKMADRCISYKHYYWDWHQFPGAFLFETSKLVVDQNKVDLAEASQSVKTQRRVH